VPNTWPSIDSSAVISGLVGSHPEISRIYVFEPSMTPLLQERFSPSTQEQEAISLGLELKRKYNLPFWEGVLLSLFHAERPSTRLLRAAAHHNETAGNFIPIERNAVSASHLRELASGYIDHRMLAVSSRVKLRDGSNRHFPMLDFHCPVSPESLRLAQVVSEELFTGRGFILRSGDSYHFYGNGLLTESELIAFLGRALLFTPIIDRAWVAHQLLESACALRISPRSSAGGAPTVVARTMARRASGATSELS
jgi:hypothetical protein